MFKLYRSHTCGELTKKEIGKEVILSGWVERNRLLGNLIFLDLRDRFGITQIVFDSRKHKDSFYSLAEQLKSEWVVSIRGKVIARKDPNPKMATGEIEIEAKELEILSKAQTPPFLISSSNTDSSEELRLKYRFLDLRRKEIYEKLILRHKVMLTTRNFLSQRGFLEIATPILSKSTPEGARDYLVPSRVYPGNFYALPQSPQLFKQILMIGGLDKYFQIAQCFRDEDLRADRQPEFTQIDLEMSFATPEILFSLIEELLQTIFKECINVEIKTPFRRMTYQECMDSYGTDKPDLRFDMKLINLSEIIKKSTCSFLQVELENGSSIKGFCIKKGASFSRKQIDAYTDLVKELGGKGLSWMKRTPEGLTGSLAKFFNAELQQEIIHEMNIEIDGLIFIVADSPSLTNKILDQLRRKVAKDEGLADPNRYEFLWVIDFPLFGWDAETQSITPEHHPFTAPHIEDLHLLESAPLKVRAVSYDAVLNGYELSSGSQRIHNSELQQKIFEAIKLSEEEIKNRFGFFIEALKYGTPPHLGAALGLDRIIMLLSQTDNIRDVIAFPKTKNANDLMTGSPSSVALDQLDLLKLKINEPKT